MGQGDAEAADQAAVQAMRNAFESVEMAGTIVIGEGERDEAPMLYIGEPVGAPAPAGVSFPRVDIAVDPLEGTNLCATGTANAIVVLAASEPGGLLHAPDCYMEKIIAGPACRDALDIDAPVKYNLKAIAHCLDRQVKDLVIMVLDRPRHQDLIGQIRAAGARIRLIQDGDLSAGIAAAVRGSGVDAVFGTGGAPEGVLTAAALRCLAGEMVARLVVNTRPNSKRAWSTWAFATPNASTRPRPRARQSDHLRRLRRHRRRAVTRRTLLRRGNANLLRDSDLKNWPSPIHREYPARRSA